MGNPQGDEGECGNQRPSKQARIGASQYESGDNGDRGECKLAQPEEPVFPAQGRLFRFEGGEPLAIDASRV